MRCVCADVVLSGKDEGDALSGWGGRQGRCFFWFKGSRREAESNSCWEGWEVGWNPKTAAAPADAAVLSRVDLNCQNRCISQDW